MKMYGGVEVRSQLLSLTVLSLGKEPLVLIIKEAG
jgi:hypothetical protein